MSSFKLGNIVQRRSDIVSAGGTTILFNNSAYYQNVTGSSNQTIQLPAANTMPISMGFMVVNSSTGSVTVKNNGGTTLTILGSGQSSEFVADDISTSNGIWFVVTGTGSSGGGGTVTFTATAGMNLNANEAVYICNSVSDGGRTVGRVYQLDVTNPFRVVFAGFTTASVLSGNSVTVQVIGELPGFSGIPVGLQIWASTTVPGSFQTTKPNTSIYLAIPVGQGSTTTGKLLINGALYATRSGTTPSDFSVGYLGGGLNGPNDINQQVDVITKVVFATDVFSTLSATLASPRDHIQSVQSNLKGYFAGGLIPGGTNTSTNTIDAFLFSSETDSTLGATLPNPTSNAAAVQSSTKGYICGAQVSSTTIQTLTFSSEITAISSSVLTTGMSNAAGFSTPSTGYMFGGSNNILNKMVFSTEVVTALGSTFSTSILNGTNPFYSSSNSKGYICGGLDGLNPIDTIYSLATTTDTLTLLAATLTVNKYEGGHVASLFNGYAVGGSPTNTTATAEIEKFSFATETSAANGSSLPLVLAYIQNGVRA